MKLLTNKQLSEYNNVIADQTNLIAEQRDQIAELESLIDQWAIYAAHLESKLRKYETVVIDHRIKSGDLTAHKVSNGHPTKVYAIELPGMPAMPDNRIVAMDSEGHITTSIKPEPAIIADNNKSTPVVKSSSNGHKNKANKVKNTPVQSTIIQNAAILTDVETKLGRKLDHIEHSKLQAEVGKWSTKESTMSQSDQWVSWLVRIFKTKK